MIINISDVEMSDEAWSICKWNLEIVLTIMFSRR